MLFNLLEFYRRPTYRSRGCLRQLVAPHSSGVPVSSRLICAAGAAAVVVGGFASRTPSSIDVSLKNLVPRSLTLFSTSEFTDFIAANCLAAVCLCCLVQFFIGRS